VSKLDGPLAWEVGPEGARTRAVLPAPWRHPHVDLDDGLLSAEDPYALVVLSLPWPPPPPKHEWGHWEPAVMERYPDGTAFGLWRWREPE